MFLENKANFLFTAENSVMFLFLQSTYNWTPIQYSYFITATTMLHLLGKNNYSDILH